MELERGGEVGGVGDLVKESLRGGVGGASSPGRG